VIAGGPAALALLLRFLSAGGGPKDAEYAARWDPSAGGPATPAEILERLGLAASSAPTACEVRYYDLPAPEGAPTGATVILRRRVCDDGTAEIRLKYRTARPVGSWACPAGLGFVSSSQVDVGLGAGAPSRVYAHSCALAAGAPPPSLHAVAKPCASRMTRTSARGAGDGRVKVEEWTLPGGGRRLEVSRNGRDDVDALAAFEAVVERLRSAGAHFLEESKTELGSRCPDGGKR
jgi:hypothetical protein